MWALLKKNDVAPRPTDVLTGGDPDPALNLMLG